MALRVQIFGITANRVGRDSAQVDYRYRVVDETDAVIVPSQGPFSTLVHATSLEGYHQALINDALERERKRREAARVWPTPAALNVAFESAIEDDVANDPLAGA